MICCKDLHLEYPDGAGIKTVLDRVNLTIRAGENVVLLGPSGSGKSSLIYLLSSLRKPTSGEVSFAPEGEDGGQALSGMNNNEAADIRRKNFGFIFQAHFLLPYLCALDNVLLGKNDYSATARKKASDLMEQMGLHGHQKKRIHQLSGGERQRVAIARALMNEPDVLFADEPTASLDHGTAMDVIGVLKNHKKDSILIMATHDTSILAGDERIIRIGNGEAKEG